MKKLIIISDSHGNMSGVTGLLPLLSENDYLIHLGAGDVRELRDAYPERVYVCAGNCDFFSPLPQEGELEIEGVKIYYCHGHKYGVKSGLSNLATEAKARGADIALYGHMCYIIVTKRKTPNKRTCKNQKR